MTATVSPCTLAAHRNLPSALSSARAPSRVTFPAPAFGPQLPSVESAGTTSIWIVSALATSTELRGSPGAASVRVSVTPDGPLISSLKPTSDRRQPFGGPASQYGNVSGVVCR